MTGALLRTAGMALLALTGFCGGWLAYCRKNRCWQQTRTFARLLEYLQESVRYHSIPCEDLLLLAAAKPEFAALDLSGCHDFAQLNVPPALRNSCGPELCEGLASLATAPHESVCTALSHMALLCRQAAQKSGEEAVQARRLYPRLGACLGVMAAIVFS